MKPLKESITYYPVILLKFIFLLFSLILICNQFNIIHLDLNEYNSAATIIMMVYVVQRICTEYQYRLYGSPSWARIFLIRKIRNNEILFRIGLALIFLISIATIWGFILSIGIFLKNDQINFINVVIVFIFLLIFIFVNHFSGMIGGWIAKTRFFQMRELKEV